MRVLAVDTSTELGSVACLVEGDLRAEVSARVRLRHGETVFTLLSQVLAHAGLERTEIDLIACGIGPGSFTGTRVGVATAKGLSLAMDVPIVGVGSMRALARGVPARWVAPILDAHKGEVYAAVYERGDDGFVERLAPIHGPPLEVVDALRRFPELCLVGSGTRRYPAVFPAAMPRIFDAPRASLVALDALERFDREGPDDRAALEPLYVRSSDAKLPQG